MSARSNDHEQSTDPEPTEMRHSGGGAWIFWCLIAVFIYVLGLGPAVIAHEKFPPARIAIEAIYSPLEYFDKHFPAAHKFFRWYLEDIWRVQ